MTDQSFSQIHLFLPVGTQVVTRVEIRSASGDVLCPRGAVGEVVKAPDDGSHSYRVRFVNGVEAALQRHEITIRKQYQQAIAQSGEEVLAEFNLYDFVIYRCIVGSRAFGLESEESETVLKSRRNTSASGGWSRSQSPHWPPIARCCCWACRARPRRGWASIWLRRFPAIRRCSCKARRAQWLSAEAALASRMNRCNRLASCVSCANKILIATRRSSFECRAFRRSELPRVVV